MKPFKKIFLKTTVTYLKIRQKLNNVEFQQFCFKARERDRKRNGTGREWKGRREGKE